MHSRGVETHLSSLSKKRTYFPLHAGQQNITEGHAALLCTGLPVLWGSFQRDRAGDGGRAGAPPAGLRALLEGTPRQALQARSPDARRCMLGPAGSLPGRSESKHGCYGHWPRALFDCFCTAIEDVSRTCTGDAHCPHVLADMAERPTSAACVRPCVGLHAHSTAQSNTVRVEALDDDAGVTVT